MIIKSDTKLSANGLSMYEFQCTSAKLLVDLTDGEPKEFAERSIRAQQASEAARILGVERLSLGLQDRFVTDTTETCSLRWLSAG